MSDGPAARRWELLSSYVDEALDEVAMAAVDRDLRRDAGMADDLLALRRQADALRGWAASVNDRPVPPGVRALLRAARAAGDGSPPTGGTPPAPANQAAPGTAPGTAPGLARACP
ncbi:hypothetical protein [Thalassobaculum sp.]|uniref:hypothetical protein n=1 Tax=Thalassobaculum sp. TaxID=2022740 RepID=UPI0032EBE48E